MNFLNKDKIRPFTKEEAENFVYEQIYELPTYILKPEFIPTAKHVHCIDDRHVEDDTFLAFPGAKAGELVTHLTALNEEQKCLGRSIGYLPQMVTTAFEQYLGMPNFHTDDHAGPEDLPCRGRGHCFNPLIHPEDYNLNHEMVIFLENYFQDLGKRIKKNNDPERPGFNPDEVIRIPIYSGEHQARAIFFVDDLTLGLRHNDGESQAYVYSRAWHQRSLRLTASQIFFRVLLILAPEVDLLSYQEKIVPEIASLRLGSTVKYLKAGNLPKFSVKRDARKEIIVVPLG